ncbi:MAG: UMP kinase [Eubacteriales bacterium]
MSQVKYKRILIKISGEALAGEGRYGIDFENTETICRKIKECLDMGVQIAIVVGAGNFWRGRNGTNLDRTRADHMGMLATVMNSIALKDTFEQIGVDARVLTAVEMKQFAEVYTRDAAVSYLESGKVVIFGCGTGNPFFTTDTAAVLRAVEINADIALFAKNIDGVYSADPRIDPNAVKYDSISYADILSNQLTVIDTAATALCKDNDLNVLLFYLGNGDNIVRAVKGEKMGTIIKK